MASSAPLETVSHEQQLFDRQVRLWGPHGQRQLRHTNILALGSSTTITEALKGVILPSVQSYTIVDDQNVRDFNISNNFFLTESDIGKPIAKCVATALNDLNTSCEPIAVIENISDFLVRLCFNTLYSVHNPYQSMDGLYTPSPTYSPLPLTAQSDIITQSKPDTNAHLSALLSNFLTTHYPDSHSLFNSLTSTTTTSLHNYTMILIDPTRIPIPLHSLISIFSSAFNTPLITLGSYSTFSLVKTSYPQRCVIETHHQINPATKNLNLNPNQLRRFSLLSTHSLSSEFDFLDADPIKPPTQTDGSAAQSSWLNMLAQRSKVPFPIILSRFAHKYAQSLNKTPLELVPADLKGFQAYIKSKMWKNEESYDEALQHSRFITSNVMISPQLLQILNNPVITKSFDANSTAIQIKGSEKIEKRAIKSPFCDAEFFTIAPLLVQIFEHVVMLDLGKCDDNNASTISRSNTETLKRPQIVSEPSSHVAHEQHIFNDVASFGDRNHPFWLLVAALRLFMLNFPIERAITALNRDEVLQLQSLCPYLPLLSTYDDLSITQLHRASSASASFQGPGMENNNNNNPGAQPTNTDNLHEIQGTLPIFPSLPDMAASTHAYQTLKKIYQKQFHTDQVQFIFYLAYVFKTYSYQRNMLLGELSYHVNIGKPFTINELHNCIRQWQTTPSQPLQSDQCTSSSSGDKSTLSRQNTMNDADEATTPKSPLSSPYSSISSFFLHLRATLHVDQPISHFLMHCRELRVNSSPTTLSFLSTDALFDDLFSTNPKFQKSPPTTATNTLSPPTNMSDEYHLPNNQTCIFFHPKHLFDCLTTQFLTTHHQLSVSFTNTYPTCTLTTMYKNKPHLNRQQSLHGMLQDYIYTATHPYLLHYYITIIALLEFQYKLHRFPESITSKSKTKISLNSGLFSISSSCSKALKVDTMTIPQSTSSSSSSHNQHKVACNSDKSHLPTATAGLNGSDSSFSALLPLSDAAANSHSDLVPLKQFHTQIFHHLLSATTTTSSHLPLASEQNRMGTEDAPSPPPVQSTPLTLYTVDGGEVPAADVLKPKFEPLDQCFAHQFTEIPTTASITGAMCADLMLKIALDQYSMIESTILFDSANKRGANLYL